MQLFLSFCVVNANKLLILNLNQATSEDVKSSNRERFQYAFYCHVCRHSLRFISYKECLVFVVYNVDLYIVSV